MRESKRQTTGSERERDRSEEIKSGRREGDREKAQIELENERG